MVSTRGVALFLSIIITVACCYGGETGADSPLRALDDVLQIDTKLHDVYNLSFSPHGDRLFFNSPSGPTVLVVPGGQMKPLTIKKRAQVVAWSNSGKYVFLATRDSQSPVLYDFSSDAWDSFAEEFRVSEAPLFEYREEKKIRRLWAKKGEAWEPISLQGKGVGDFKVSPDRLRVVIFYVGKTEVFDVKLWKRFALPIGEGHIWTDDGQRLLYIVAEDDGHFVTSSSLRIVDFDGTNDQVLVPMGPYDIYPIGCARGSTIALSWREPSRRDFHPPCKLVVARLPIEARSKK